MAARGQQPSDGPGSASLLPRTREQGCLFSGRRALLFANRSQAVPRAARPPISRSRRLPALLPAVGWLLTAALAGCMAPPSAPTRAAGEERIARQMEEALGPLLLHRWYPAAVDTAYGGFLSTFDADWRPVGPQDKMIVTQARHVWTTARAAAFYPADTARYAPAARHGYRFLRDHLWDARHGGFHTLVSRAGAPRPDAEGRLSKTAYGNAFGLYALAAYYDLTRDPEALAFAVRAFRWLDAHAHDPVYQGYFQFLAEDGAPYPEGYEGAPPKDQNSSIHLLEAFTELYRVWPDPVLRARLEEMLALIRDVIRVEPGYLTLYATRAWAPVSYRDSSEAARARGFEWDHVSYGHDIETAYLLLEAAEALGGEADPATERAAKSLADHALRFGMDPEAGGLYDAGYYFRGAAEPVNIRQTKNWWAQAEAFNTLLILARRYPDDPMRYAERFERQWAYVWRYVIDHERGGWHQGGLDRQPEYRDDLKGHVWKAAYHDGRALMNTLRRLERPPLPGHKR